ncbi:ribonuclease III [Microbacterium sediminis]|uniref:Ribonuclease 3 n=1 Tax=Microbacterium sediminis TaxID=904291 RepID=A0A1B9NFE7_9MICO|nr:ribonuclease III [Microbacterium sediminis]OCG75307.1 ribonuclease III [Microbacterium sediminis]QBR74328.1 ribonuclease III [Microbacterium sediminis]
MTEIKGRISLIEKLGVDIDAELLDLALTHRSWAYEHGGVPHNERLEFLGDSVLSLAVTSLLYERFPDESEGTLSKRRASVVSMLALADVARGIGLGEHLKLGRGEEQTGGREKDSILADATEAIFGAVFLSAGRAEALALVQRLITPLVEDPERYGAAVDPKTAVQELAARWGVAPPSYEVTAEGPSHDRRFTAVITVGDHQASGQGTSKKQAEMAAALRLWREAQAQESVAGA